jgi:hypothetical protein
MAREFRAGDCVLAMTSQPDLALSLTCNQAAQWRVTVFDLGEKKAALTDHHEPSLEHAKRFVASFVAEKYGLDVSGVSWREVLIIRPSGPSG